VLVGLSLLFAAGVADLAWGVVFGLSVRLSDALFAGAMQVSRTPALTAFLEPYTRLGDLLVASCIVLACCAALWLAQRRSYALFLVGVTASAALVNAGVKEIVDRTRPPAMLAVVALPHSASFPSGHAVIGLTLGGALAILVMLEFGVGRGIVPAAALIALGALLGISRVYLGVHWWSDVLGGWLFALAWLSAWSALWLWLLLRREAGPTPPGARATGGA
jgi:membrane-associated phospholipid phosphatase